MCGSVIADGCCGPDGFPGHVEGGEDALRGALAQATTVRADSPGDRATQGIQAAGLPAVAGLASDRGALSHPGEEDRGEHPAGIAAIQCAATEEALDLLEEAVNVPAAGEAQRVVLRLLEIAGAGYMGCEIPSVAWRGHDVAAALYHERRHVNRRQHRADIDLADHPDDPQERLAQFGEAHLQVRSSPAGRKAGPQLVCQPVGRDHGVRVDEQKCQHRPGPGAPDPQQSSAGCHLQRTKDSELHCAPLIRTRAAGAHAAMRRA